MQFIIKTIKSFSYAFAGIYKSFRGERPFKIHLAAAVFISLLGFYFGIGKTEWCILILCCALVISMELMNTGLERLSDLVKKDYDEQIKFSKDAGAGAVLIASLASVIVGMIIFYPYFKKLFSL